MKAVTGVDGTFLPSRDRRDADARGRAAACRLPAGYQRRLLRRPQAAAVQAACTWCPCSPASSRRCRCSSPTRSGSRTTRRSGLSRAAHHPAEPRHAGAARRLRRPLHSELLDRNRPLWRIAVIDGLDNGECRLLPQGPPRRRWTGRPSVLMVQTLFDPTPNHAASRGKLPARRRASGHGRLAAAIALRHDAGEYLKLLRHLPDVLRTLAGLFGPRTPSQGPGPPRESASRSRPKTPLNMQITGERGFAALSIPLDTLKAARRGARHQAQRRRPRAVQRRAAPLPETSTAACRRSR